MTTPKDNALHLMEGQGGAASGEVQEALSDEQILACLDKRQPVRLHHGAAVFEYRLFALIDFARRVLSIAPQKTAHTLWVDEVEASGEAAKHTHTAIEWLRNNYQDHPSIASLCEAMAPILHADAAAARYEIATLKATLAISQELFARERGITKELAAVLKDAEWRINDVRDMLMKRNGRDESIYGCDEWSTPTVNLATAHKVITAALSKVQHVAARGAEVSE